MTVCIRKDLGNQQVVFIYAQQLYIIMAEFTKHRNSSKD